jgi:ABC-type amino acid transport substrate-binding protein
MNKRRIFALAAALLCGLLAAGVVWAMSSASYAIEWNVIAGGGGHSEAGSYSLDFTIGQPIVGVATDTGYELCSGFWCGAVVEYKIYLPIVLKNYS